MEDIFSIIGKDFRNDRIDIRVSEEEKLKIQKRADKKGLTVSQYCRQSALNYKPSKVLSDEELNTLKELKIAEEKILSFNDALKLYSKNMTKEQRLKFILDVRTLTEWATVIEEAWKVCVDVKKKL